jgi:hypothetical protein
MNEYEWLIYPIVVRSIGCLCSFVRDLNDGFVLSGGDSIKNAQCGSHYGNPECDCSTSSSRLL